MAKSKPKAQAEHTSFLAYKNYRYLKVSIVICLISLTGYLMTDFEPAKNGGTWYGYTLGTIAALLIFWLSLLGMRKRWISAGHWSLKAWTSAHVYLGLSLIVVATLHTGFQFGWNVHLLAYVLMMIVIGSGLFGIYFYAVVPSKMSQNRGEISQSAMLQDINNLGRMLKDSAQPLADTHIERVQDSITKTKLGGNYIKRLSGKDKKCPTAAALRFFRAELKAVDNAQHGPILDVISVLERKNALLNRIRRHIKYKAILQGWLYIHIPFTFALIAALTAHIVSVFFYS